MARVTGIGGVFFKARDPEALGEWYRKHLGVPVEEGGWAVFHWEGSGATTWALFPADTEYFGPGDSSCMVNFRVADLDSLLAELRREGVTVLDKVEEHEYGRFGWIVDPEGNRVELWQPGPGA